MQETLAHQDARGCQVAQVLMVKMDQQGLMVTRGHLDHQVHLVMMVLLESQVLLAMKVLKEKRETMVRMGRTDSQGLQENLVKLELQALQGQQVHQVLTGLTATAM